MPKAHVEAPVSGSIILAGILLKLGGYGIIRVSFLSDPRTLFSYFLSISLFGGGLLGVRCLKYRDIKVVIAYSSVVHMAIVIRGLAFTGKWGLEGGVIIMIAHGICSSGLFGGANIIYERSHSRSYFFNGGGLTVSPIFSLV